jgi:hypothetical protein
MCIAQFKQWILQHEHVPLSAKSILSWLKYIKETVNASCLHEFSSWWQHCFSFFLVNAFPTSKIPLFFLLYLKGPSAIFFILISSLYVTVLFHRIIPFVSVVNAVKTWHLSYFYIIKFTLVSIFYFSYKKNLLIESFLIITFYNK